MAGEHDAAVDFRADRRKKRRLVARGIRHFHIIDAESGEIGFDIGNEREIGLRALGIERDEPFHQGERRRRADPPARWH